MLRRIGPVLLSFLTAGIMLSAFLVYGVFQKTAEMTREEKLSAQVMLLGEEMRNDSRMLTSAARTLVALGPDSEVENSFLRILEIRQGKAPRTSTDLAPGRKISFEALLDTLSLTELERQTLLKAYQRSEKLAHRELQAIRLSQGLEMDNVGQYTISAPPSREKALELVFGKEYRHQSTEINESLSTFFSLLSQRTQQQTATIQREMNFLLIGVCVCIFMVLVSFTVASLQSREMTIFNTRMAFSYVLTMIILLVAVAGPALLVYFDARQAMESATEKRQRLMASEIQHELELRITHTLDMLRIVAQQPSVYGYFSAAGPEQAKAKANALITLQGFNNSYTDTAELLLMTTYGKVVVQATMEKLTPSQMHLNRDQLLAVLRGEPQVFSAAGVNGVELYIAVPVLSKGTSGGVMGALISVVDRTAALNFWQGRMLAEEQMGIFVMDREGRIVTSSRGDDTAGRASLSDTLTNFVRNGGSGALRYNDLGDGSQRLAYVMPVDEPNWVVGVASDYSAVGRQTGDILVRSLFFGTAAVLVAIALVSLLLQYLTDSLRRSTEREQNIIAGAGMFTWDYDVKAGAFSHNAQWIRVAGLPTPPAPGVMYIGWVIEHSHPEDVHYITELSGPIGRGKYVNFEMRLRVGSGQERWLALMGRIEQVDAAGNTLRVAGTGYDVTARKMAELSEVERKQKLEELVAQRTEELVVSRNLAEAASQAKSDFLSTVSHEIRTPMNAIVGFSHLFDRANLTDEQKEHLAKIKLSADTLLNIINDVLDISKIEADKLELEHVTFNLQNLLDTVRSIADYGALEKKLEVTIDVDPNVPRSLRGDPKRISQVLLNLLNNGIKFTNEGWVLLRVNLGECDIPGKILLDVSVSDSGIGLTEEQIGRLFKPFGQVDSSVTRRFGGTGLGLAICKKLVEMMGGSITVHSVPNVGSTFHFTLCLDKVLDAPPRDTAPGQQEDTEDSLGPLAGKRVLLVEDNAINQEIATLVLEEAGIMVDVAQHGREAIGKAEAFEYDLILMDMQMPVMGGLEATENLRRMGRERSWLITVPIIAMTANAMAEDKQACMAAGMNDHLAKPFDPPALYMLLRHWMGLEANMSPSAAPPQAAQV